MSGLPTTAIPDRRALIAVAGELTGVLKSEIRQLSRDAQSFELQGRPLLAANMRTIRQRFANVLKLAEDVAAQGTP
jgi:hypothetical protein